MSLQTTFSLIDENRRKLVKEVMHTRNNQGLLGKGLKFTEHCHVSTTPEAKKN